MNAATDADAGTFCPVGALDIYSASPHQQALAELLRFSPAPMIDLGAVSGCDTTGAQLLWAALQTALANGKPLTIKNVSPAVQAVWHRLGLPDTLLKTPLV